MTDTRRSTGDSGRDVESSQSSRSDQPSDPGDLVVVCGLPGAGKTTVAERISDRSDARILRTDVIRKELFSDPTYTEAETEAVYAELLERARDAVLDGRSVVLDATFAKRQFREDARELAERVANRFELVKVECDESVVRERIERRDGISDADFDVYLHFTELFDGIDSEHLVVDNSGSEATTFAQIDSAFE
ncbi:AAA family ATPase [Halorubrum luteum]